MFGNKNSQTPQIHVMEYKNQGNFGNSAVSKWWIWLIIAIAAVIILVLGFLFWRTQNQLNVAKKDLQQQNDPANKLQEENKQLIERVSKLIVLPSDEEPTIATVSDLNKLKDQPFFAKAELGDKVLIYSQAKKAILYRPSTNQIIELAPLLNGTVPAAETAPAVSPTPAQ